MKVMNIKTSLAPLFKPLMTGDVHSEISDSDDGYEVPRIYSSAAVNIKSAKKKSNFSNANLEDRMRKASGIGRVEQMWIMKPINLNQFILHPLFLY